ncbi:MAG: hypothetical protein IJF87_08085 [Erysipelotrichaceae bacterium]|nr:hypothetical protein [Erysipelotrichaceae bacterium]
MKKKKFITRVVLLFLLVTGCLTFRSIQAATNNNSVKLTFSLPAKEDPNVYDVDDEMVDVIVYDLYYIAPIKWDGSGDGTATSTKYYIPSGSIVSSYQSAFPDSFKDSVGNINISEREKTPGQGDYELVNTALKDYTLSELANDLARIIYDGSITPDTSSTDSKDKANLIFGEKNSGIEDGMYLVLVHVNGDSNYLKKKIVKEPVEGTDTYTEKDVYYTAANSKYHEYDFNPFLVFLKNTDLEGTPKYEESFRYDDLLIVKELGGVLGKAGENDQEDGLEFDGFEPVTFVYDVIAYDPKDKDGETVVYHDVASISFEEMGSAKDLIGQTIAEKIPVGARVVVTEIYNGSSYALDEDNSNGETTIIVSERNTDGTHKTDADGKYVYITTVETSDSQTEKVIFAYVSFVNDPGNKPNPGYGINNPYKYDAQKGWEYIGENKKPNTDDKRGG